MFIHDTNNITTYKASFDEIKSVTFYRNEVPGVKIPEDWNAKFKHLKYRSNILLIFDATNFHTHEKGIKSNNASSIAAIRHSTE